MARASRKIHLSLIQIDPTPRRASKRVQKTLDLVAETAKHRPGMIVLPEIWSGGFKYPEVRKAARETPEILKELCAISKEFQATIIGSLPEQGPNKLYNTAAIIDQGRIIGRYRKQRLFSPMEEDRHFGTCPSKKIFSTTLGEVNVAICFDLRFPELFTRIREKSVWLLVIPAQWPEPRCHHWESLLIARAIENQVFVAGCNRVGRTCKTRFCGNSMIVDPWGKVVARGGRRAEVVSARVHPEDVDEVRKRLPMQRTGRSR